MTAANDPVKSIPLKIPHYLLEDNGVFPNSTLPVLLYKSVFSFSGNPGPSLIIYRGNCEVILGVESGIHLLLKQGDCLILPVGVAHKNGGASEDFKCVGAYPEGRDLDINIGKEGEHPQTDKNIRSLPLPKRDPIYGAYGHIHTLWHQR
jgi:uncharacterized protein YjlB